MSAVGRCGLALLLLLGAIGREAAAQTTCNVNNTASCNTFQTLAITVGTGVRVSMASATVDLGSPLPADYNAGYIQATGPLVTVMANTAWTLHIGLPAGTSFWTAAGGARANKPAGELSWSRNAGGPFIALTTAGANVSNGLATAGTNAQIFFRSALAWTLDTPGTYTLVVTYTITAP